MDTLRIDLRIRRRDFPVQVTLTAGRETLGLVGPSGSGKTTVLRVVAGLDRPERGRVVVGGRVLLDTDAGIDVPVEDRRVGYVVQEGALFPHMSVAQNVAFGASGDVGGLMRRLGLDHLADVRPGRISGGERQRVALARALARDPEVLLLDEPLSALDAQTRPIVRGELANILAGMDVPVVMVTHDFLDAAMLSARIGVMNAGRVVQVASARDLVARPADGFVATFTGANVLRGVAVAGSDGLTLVSLDGGGEVRSVDAASGPVDVVVSPWDVTVARVPGAGSAQNAVVGRVGSVVGMGNRTRVQVGPLVAEISGASTAAMGVRVGDELVATFKAAATRLVARTREPPV